ncbi:MAG: hypothetical protein HN576_03860 [Bacteriovoracaceae bacterium]|jgi:hypothetical protein|nr:hypothetical protein [Bacteriovoracaceae bacterium]
MDLIQTIDIKLFISKLPPDVISLINLIMDQGFELTLVGGSVRDFAICEEMSDDFDFELRDNNSIGHEEFLSKYKKLINYLECNHNVICEPLPFLISRLKYNDCEIELSIPRLENYKETQNAKKHRDFGVDFDSRLIHKDAFLRRDFTINSLGIHFQEKCLFENAVFIDPQGGLEDLSQGKLKTCNPDFNSDPVRFLRMIRFHLRFGFELDDSLKVGTFNLQKLTFYYIEKEFNTLCNKNFFHRMWCYLDNEQININAELQSISFLKDLSLCDGLELYDNILKSFQNNNTTDVQVLLLSSLFGWKKKTILKILKQIK